MMFALRCKANLRDKIRDECGSRGKEWYKKNISNKEENKAHKFD